MADGAIAGLSHAQAAERLQRDGFNELPQTRRRTLWRIAVEVVREPMFQLLVAAGAIYLILGNLDEALMLLAFVAITIGITISQERRTEKVLEALRDLSSPRALVMRGGERLRVAGREVVCGDVMLLAEGDRVPADGTLIWASQLQTDESLLTGESVPVRKRAPGEDAVNPAPPGEGLLNPAPPGEGLLNPAPLGEGLLNPAPPGGDDLPFVYSGSLVVRGQGAARVHATGARSEMGQIGRALVQIAPEPTPLHAQTRRLVRIFAALGLLLSVAVVLLYGLTRGAWLDGLLAGITLAMAMLPQEFALILTVFMAMGAWRMSRHQVLTRRAAAIEALGSATVLCTDKTGTLTVNRMAIAELAVDGQVWSASQTVLPEVFHPVLEFGILASEREPFDAMEQAFHALGRQYLQGTEHLHADWAMAREYGLQPELLAMSQVWTGRDAAGPVIACKGAPEAIADLCHLDPTRLAEVRAAAEAMAGRGLRVLGVARAQGRLDGMPWPAQQHDFDFEFVGLVGLADPLRESVPAAVRGLERAGIKVVMITGDHPATALAVARQAGLVEGVDPADREDANTGRPADARVMTGDELAALSDEALRQRVSGVTVFARINPTQKLRIVNAFKARGEVVAMTGDGVNDAPSLKAAHIGIAMGGRGTDVAREAAALVLLDDDFASIAQAVRLGRRIFDNLRKAMAFVLAVHVPIAGLALLPLLLGWPLVFMPVHIAFLELLIDPVCSIVFEAEPEEGDVMDRPPRDPQAPLFSLQLLGWSLFQGAVVLAAVAAFFASLLHAAVPEAQARAAVFVALVGSNFALIWVNRSIDARLGAALRRPNSALWRMLAVTSVLLAAALFVAPVREVFRFAPLPLPILVAALGLGAAVLMLLGLLNRGRATLAGRAASRP